MSWASKLAKPYRVEDGDKFRLKDFDPGDTRNIRSKARAKQLLERGVAAMTELQDKLYAQDRWGVLLIFQGIDAAGKDGAIKHVMSGVNPQGCQVYSFKAPSSEELNHDSLWRTMQRVPERGRIGIFNRSYYEEVLVVRVHPELLKNEKDSCRLWSPRISGRIVFKTSMGSSAICGATGSSFANSSSICRKRSRRDAFLTVWISPGRTGNSPPPTCASASTGTITCTLSKT